MIALPDTAKVCESFSKAARVYDAWADHQRIIAARLCELIPRPSQRRRILELGCGTGVLTSRLSQHMPASRITAVDAAPGMVDFCRQRWPGDSLGRFILADAHSFYDQGAFDLIAASCSLQWFGDRARVIGRMRGMLSPGGVVLLAVPVSGTLAELAESYRAMVGAAMPGLGWWEAARYIDLMNAAGLPPTYTSVESVRVRYDEPLDVLRAIKAIGATFAGRPDWRPLPAGTVRRMLAHYRKRFGDVRGRVSSTYRVLYMVNEVT